MTKLEKLIGHVLEQQKPKLAAETWESRRRYFNQMLKLAETMGFNEPCQELYDAYIANDNGSNERRGMHIHCVKLLDAVAGTKSKNEYGVSYNESPLPGKTETEEYFRNRPFPIRRRTSLDHLIVKAEMEMQHLSLSESTAGQYRHAWMDLRRYFIEKGSAEYDEPLAKAFLHDIDLWRTNGSMKEWKWKINRKATRVLIEVANTGAFNWGLINRNERSEGTEIDSIRGKYAASLTWRNLSKSTIDLYDYVFRKTMSFIGAKTRDDISSFSPEKVQLAIIGFDGICNKRSMATIIPILRSLLVFLYVSGFTEKDLSNAVMGVFVQRGKIAAYISEKDQANLTAQLENESKRDKAIILLAMKLGLRDCDICSLTFKEIDWMNDKIRLNQIKTGAPLVLPLIPDVGNALMDYIINERPNKDNNSPFVFLRAQAPHMKLVSAYTICSKLFGKMGIKPVNGKASGVHVLRYTVVHRLLKAKVPHQTITDILGHTSKEADKPYLSMEESMLRECALDLTVIGRVTWGGGCFA